MKIMDQEDRVIDLEVCGDEDDVQIEAATYQDDGSEVPEDVIDYIYERYAEQLGEMWQEKQQGMADDYMEDDR